MRINSPSKPQGIRCLVRLARLFVVAMLSGCGGGGGGGNASPVLTASLDTSASDILASQIASGNADRLSAFLLNTDSPAITRLTGKVVLDSFLAKHPVDRFEMLSAGRNPHVMLACPDRLIIAKQSKTNVYSEHFF